MDTNNPYSSPQSNLFSGSAATSAETVTQGVMLQLKKTRPWVRFMSVLMFVGAGLMLLVGLFVGLAGGVGAFSKANPEMSTAFRAGFGVGMAVVYGLLAALYIFPALKLWKYADRIRDLCNSMHTLDLEKALNEQRSFWKFVGVMALVMICIYVVAIGVGVAIGIGAAVKAGGR